MHGCANKKANSRRMDGLSISIMSVQRDRRGTLESGVGIGIIGRIVNAWPSFKFLIYKRKKGCGSIIMNKWGHEK